MVCDERRADHHGEEERKEVEELEAAHAADQALVLQEQGRAPGSPSGTHFAPMCREAAQNGVMHDGGDWTWRVQLR